ncbi:hypothetical protein P4V86_22720 [Brevibacillus laterosporus]|uniref:hypothetical protein n=1 Tax=Brevibacillus laterosporus TaxID=1465 RepID=UPI00037FAEDC|nr:hypothetical protein [Brevibacillus laterosporus]ATO51841.1 hypothetical protein BrL25_23735 [Brevibacillus laterosporus DSM 25]MED2006142.1 hypothetical protein [Brevibacillus laterosporus]
MDRAFASKFAKRAFCIILVLFFLSYVGSRSFTHMDLALYGYMIGTLVFIGGFLYRFGAWAERPPTKLIIKKGIKLLFRKNSPQTATEQLVTYRFIWNRHWYRWTQHILIGWGCMLAAFVTFPLVFGWMYFTMPVNRMYTVVFMGIDLMTIKADGFLAYCFYNGLNISAFMVISGVSMALYRRFKDMQARAEQSFVYDFLPLYLLMAISITGLFLTASNLFFAGFGHPVLKMIHQFFVIITLIYLPFGKLAHVPFRPLSVFARNYRLHYSEQSMKTCKLCDAKFVSREQSNDVIEVLQQNHISFEMQEGFHLAELCLPCRRKYRMSRFTGKPTHHTLKEEGNQHANG